MDESTPITVAIVDDHQILVETLSLVVQSEPGLQMVGSASTCAGCLDLLQNINPAVLILDVNLPDGDGLSLVPKINQLRPDTAILVLTSFADENTLLRAMDLGVSGFVGKNHHLSEVMGAIRQAANGEIAIPASLLLGLLGRKMVQPMPAPEPAKLLTARERDILSCLAKGNSSTEIAEKFNISTLTVRTHIRNLNDKLGVHSRLEAVTCALRQGLIEPPV